MMYWEQAYWSLSSIFDKHAPSKHIYVVERPVNDWMTDDILVLKGLRRKYESLWHKITSLFTLICIQKVVWM